MFRSPLFNSELKPVDYGEVVAVEHFNIDGVIDARGMRGTRMSDIKITVGGVIPPDDVPELLDMGAVAVYPPGTVIPDAALELLEDVDNLIAGETLRRVGGEAAVHFRQRLLKRPNHLGVFGITDFEPPGLQVREL